MVFVILKYVGGLRKMKFRNGTLILAAIVIAGNFDVFSVNAATVNLTVNGATKQGTVPHFWSECVGTGWLAYSLKPEWQVAAKIGAEEAGFKRVRGHGILMGWNNVDRVGIFHWNGTSAPTYTWATFDTIYDYIVKTCKMQPIVELSFMPKDLQTNGQTSKPKDYNIYRDMIKEIVSHCIERYGLEEVRQWYWEVWNEFDYSGFFNGQPSDYYMMYQKASEGAKLADPQIIVGGPASTSTGALNGFVNYCTTNNVKYDFLSNHCYGGGGTGPNADPAVVRDDNRSRADAIKKTGKKLFSLNTEYNSSYSGSGGNTGDNCYSMDNHINAPFVVKCVKLILDDHTVGTYTAPDVLSYWAISDVFDEQPPNNGGSYIENNNKIPFGRVFGLINYQGIRKATFNAFKLMHMLGTTRLACTGGTGANDGVDGFATLSADGSQVTVIMYNFFKTLNSGNENTINLTINSLPLVGNLKVTHYRIDETHSNAYNTWVKQGKLVSPSAAQWDEMRTASNLAQLEPEAVYNNTGGNAYTKSIVMPPQSVSMLVFQSPVSTGHMNNGVTEPVAPAAIAMSGSTVIATGGKRAEELAVSLFSLDGKLVASFATASASFDVRDIKTGKGAYLMQVRYGNCLLRTRIAKY
jgi:xylan 1,4-beta-xylosidase